MTITLCATYTKCNPSFSYSLQAQPKRVLTTPDEPTSNNGHDNVDGNLIIRVKDCLGDR